MATSTEAGQPTARGVRISKRRAETRQRLLDAAFDAFAAEGFGRCTVEQICERAGYTRGAFYSNFTSLEELFLAMWEQRSQRMLHEVTAVLEQNASAATVPDLRAGVARVLQAVPLDDKWFRITYEFTAHALRNPALRRTVAAREDAIISALLPVVETTLKLVGRTVPDPAALGRALVAVHDGTATQCLLEPDSATAREQRIDLFTRVVLAYSEPRG
ncbi:TetR/AcrR family transcriptional regulator [Nocardia transvalensis]|uniref:TetR/AcrR family transcriptional regulator n=1 Tax=Nocardia transvalensis TaxID=37333 RepID=UPI0018950625|nr:TetR/AcrR family transcriptional regulator [Nocardia transvalensis]MBF6332715.1 TetR/AcrR family transcriptional regulator [Nocardia transvalensis]